MYVCIYIYIYAHAQITLNFGALLHWSSRESGAARPWYPVRRSLQVKASGSASEGHSKAWKWQAQRLASTGNFGNPGLTLRRGAATSGLELQALFLQCAEDLPVSTARSSKGRHLQKSPGSFCWLQEDQNPMIGPSQIAVVRAHAKVGS